LDASPHFAPSYRTAATAHATAADPAAGPGAQTAAVEGGGGAEEAGRGEEEEEEGGGGGGAAAGGAAGARLPGVACVSAGVDGAVLAWATGGADLAPSALPHAAPLPVLMLGTRLVPRAAGAVREERVAGVAVAL
jgi:hypothetical protein